MLTQLTVPARKVYNYFLCACFFCLYFMIRNNILAQIRSEKMMFGRILEKNKFMFQINRFRFSMHIGNGAISKYHNVESNLPSPCRKNNNTIIQDRKTLNATRIRMPRNGTVSILFFKFNFVSRCFITYEFHTLLSDYQFHFWCCNVMPPRLRVYPPDWFPPIRESRDAETLRNLKIYIYLTFWREYCGHGNLISEYVMNLCSFLSYHYESDSITKQPTFESLSEVL